MRAMRGMGGLVVIVVVAIGALVLFGRGSRGVAPTPSAFAGAVTLDEALKRSESENRPVLVFATADWCGPCQQLKRGALASASVAQAIRAGTIPVYADVTRSDEPTIQIATRLRIGPIPALILISGGQEIARHEGNASAAAIEKWLHAAVTRATPGG